MPSCSSGATFAGVPCQSRTSQALSTAGSSADPTAMRHRWDADDVSTPDTQLLVQLPGERLEL